MENPPDGESPLGQCAGGTHPTGMHSCDSEFWDLNFELLRKKTTGCTDTDPGNVLLHIIHNSNFYYLKVSEIRTILELGTSHNHSSQHLGGKFCVLLRNILERNMVSLPRTRGEFAVTTFYKNLIIFALVKLPLLEFPRRRSVIHFHSMFQTPMLSKRHKK